MRDLIIDFEGIFLPLGYWEQASKKTAELFDKSWNTTFFEVWKKQYAALITGKTQVKSSLALLRKYLMLSLQEMKNRNFLRHLPSRIPRLKKTCSNQRKTTQTSTLQS